jgi:predicted DCC family thiol-disulfide oxidoreductase YuxK
MAERSLRNSAAPALTVDADSDALHGPAAEQGVTLPAGRPRRTTTPDERGVDAVVERRADEQSASEGTAASTQDGCLTVYFDGACPLCAKEIGFYRRRPGADAVCWVDISAAAGGDVAPDLPFETAMARFHVRRPDGSLESGGAAFSRLWSEMPGFRLIGRFTQLAPVAWLLERAYRFFLRFRPRLQRLAAGRE